MTFTPQYDSQSNVDEFIKRLKDRFPEMKKEPDDHLVFVVKKLLANDPQLELEKQLEMNPNNPDNTMEMIRAQYRGESPHAEAFFELTSEYVGFSEEKAKAQYEGLINELLKRQHLSQDPHGEAHLNLNLNLDPYYNAMDNANQNTPRQAIEWPPKPK